MVFLRIESLKDDWSVLKISITFVQLMSKIGKAEKKYFNGLECGPFSNYSWQSLLFEPMTV